MSATAPGGPTESVDPPGDQDEVARIICLRLLDRRAYTRAELEAALRKRAVPAEASARVLDRFTQLGLIDDAALAHGFALAVHRERGLAARAVAEKLRHRGVADETIRAAVEDIGPQSEVDTARRLVDRRLRSMTALDSATRTRRLVGLLARKGYSPALAHEVVRSALRGTGFESNSVGPDELAIDDAAGI